jgi:hypothetical protein
MEETSESSIMPLIKDTPTIFETEQDRRPGYSQLASYLPPSSRSIIIQLF